MPLPSLKIAYEKLTAGIPDGKTWEEVFTEYGPSAYVLVSTVIDTYMDIDEDDRKILTAWIMAAAFKDGFETMPILFINGSAGSGKTRLEKIIAALLPESVMTMNLTESALFRLNSVKRCLLIDEAEKGQISNRDRVNLTELLNSCYKRVGQVIRIEKEKGGRLVPQYYDVYNPVVLANIHGLSSIIEDRSIMVVLRKTRNKAKSRLRERFEKDPLVKAVQEWFRVCCAGVGLFLEHGLSSVDYASSLYNIIYTQPSIPSPIYTTDVVHDFWSKSEGLYVDGRNFELWLPLLEITYTLDPKLMDDLISIAQQRVHDKVEDKAEFDRDTSTAIVLYAYINTLQEPRMYPKDFRDYYMVSGGLSKDEEKKHWMSPEWVGHFLKRTKAVGKKDRTNRGYIYTISKAKLKDYLEARDALDDAMSAPIAQAQPQGRLAGAAPEAKEVPLGGVSVKCPVCGEDVSKLYENPYLPLAGGRVQYSCLACFNSMQHKDDDKVIE